MHRLRSTWMAGVWTAGFVALLAAPAAPASAANLLENWQFATVNDLTGWSIEPGIGLNGGMVWTALDPDNDRGIGSLRLINRANHGDFVWAHQCIPVDEGTAYRFGVSIHNVDHEPMGQGTYGLRFYSGLDCEPASALATFDTRAVIPVGTWVPGESGPVTAPPGSRSAALRLGLRKNPVAAGNALADFSLPFVERVGGAAAPDPGDEGWFTDPQYPDFQFHVTIGAGASTRQGAWEPVCLPETVCVSGALPGRAEVFLRIVGPRPNGHLWPTLFKASPSRFEVWIEQLSSGVTKQYVLEAAGPGSDELPGLFDRTGFLP